MLTQQTICMLQPAEVSKEVNASAVCQSMPGHAGACSANSGHAQHTPFGQRLHTLREQAGLSQQQVADRLGLTQRAYAHWERNPVALRPDQLLGLAEALNVSVEDLVGANGTRRRGTGPTGKMKQLFEAASRLPRNQQQKLTAVLEAFVNQHSAT
jgi:transcriptional regulator with XRE-family HTH domain